MAFLSKEDLLKKAVFKVERVDFPNGDHVFVRQMSAKMKDDLENSVIRKVIKNGKIDYEQDLSGFSAKLAALSICDEAGNLLLSIKDAVMLAENKPAEMIDLIATKAGELSGISTEARADAVKNSENDQPEDSSSGCVEN